MMIHTTLDHTFAIALLSVTLVACQPTPTGDLTQTPPPPSATATQSAFVNPPINPTVITHTPAPTFPATSTPQPFITDGGALPEGARMRIGIGYINAAAPSPDGTMVAVGTSTGIYVYRLPGFERVWRRYTEYPIETLQWTNDSRRLLTGSHYGHPAIWDTQTGEKLLEFSHAWLSGDWSPDETMVAVASSYDSVVGGLAHSVQIHDSQSGAFLQALDIRNEDPYNRVATSVAWSRDGQLVAGGTPYETTIWNVNSGETYFVASTSAYVWDIQPVLGFSPDSRHFSIHETSHYRETVTVWDVVSTQEVHQFLFDDPVDELEWSPDGGFAAALNSDGDLIVVRIADWETLFSVSEVAQEIEWSPDSNWILAQAYDQIAVLDAHTGVVVASQPDVHYRYMSDGGAPKLSWLGDNRRIMTSNQRDIALWDWQSQSVLGGFSTNARISEIAWSADGNILILSSDSDYQYWDVASGVMIPAPNEFDPASLTFSESLHYRQILSPDGALTATATFGGGGSCDGPFCGRGSYDSGEVVVETLIGQIVFQGTYPNTGIYNLAWSPDGTLLAIGCARIRGDELWATGPNGNEVIVVDITTGQEIVSLSGHSGNVLGLAWSSNGYWLASTSADATVIVWQITR